MMYPSFISENYLANSGARFHKGLAYNKAGKIIAKEMEYGGFELLVPLRALVKDYCQVGSNSAHAICRAYGIDPDKAVKP